MVRSMWRGVVNSMWRGVVRSMWRGVVRSMWRGVVRSMWRGWGEEHVSLVVMLAWWSCDLGGHVNFSTSVQNTLHCFHKCLTTLKKANITALSPVSCLCVCSHNTYYEVVHVACGGFIIEFRLPF